MDLDADGHLDVLSGSYSRMDRDMAGLFQVLRGSKDGLRKAAPLHGSDGALLLMPQSDREDKDLDRICTRPFACDLDGDGKLDLVAGNFGGTFAWFRGEGDGKFTPAATWLAAGGELMRVDMHSDPFLIDFDGDGDLDLLSGSAAGGVFLFANTGSKTAPKFAGKVTLVAAAEQEHGPDAPIRFGDGHLQGPGADSRVWVADVDGDGKLDLLVGDQQRLTFPLAGIDEAAAREQLVAWNKQQQELFATPQGEDEAAQQKWQQAYEKLEAARAKIVRDESTGFVWLLRQR